MDDFRNYCMESEVCSPLLKTDEPNYMKDLMDKWGYKSLLPENIIGWPRLQPWVHNTIGSYLIVVGLISLYLNVMIVLLHKRFSRALIDPTGVLLLNFIFCNLGLTLSQTPWAALASFNKKYVFARWIFGDSACRSDGAAGLLFSLGIVWSHLLLAVDRYLMTCNIAFQEKEMKYRGKVYFAATFCQWLLVLVMTGPPMLGVAGRFFYEPSGTICALDYWHENFRNYYFYACALICVGYVLPVLLTSAIFVSTSADLQLKKYDNVWTKIALEHHVGMLRFCGFSYIVLILCWTPYALLWVWPIAFDAKTINIYVTLIPSLVMKLAPVFNAYFALRIIPRVNVAKKWSNKSDATHVPIVLTGANEPLLYIPRITDITEEVD